MNIIKIVAVAMLSIVAIVLLRQTKSDLSVVLSVCVCIVVFAMVANQLYDVVYSFYDLSLLTGLDKQSVGCVVKIVGIGYIAEFSNNICVDANCKTIGDRVLFASKIAIALSAMPVLTQLFGIIMGLVK